MSEDYEQLNRKKLEELQDTKFEKSINLTDKRLYHEMTGDTGGHDFMLEQLDQQMSILGEIRKTGRPAHLEPAQEQSERYQKIGHFDKKARKSAAKEALSLTNKAKELNQKLHKMPENAVTITYDLKMTELLKQAETETLKANGFAEGSPEFDRMNLKYLRHSEIIMENTLQDKDLKEDQMAAVSQSLLQVQSKIDDVLENESIQDVQGLNYIETVAREADKPALSPEEGEAVLQRTARVAENIPVDLHRLSVISPKLFRVEEKQIEEFAKKYDEKKQEEESGPVSNFEKYIQKHDLRMVEKEDNQYTAQLDKMLAYLDKHKEELGGSPHFNNERPKLVEEKRTIFGYPWSVFKEWVKTHSRKKLSAKTIREEQLRIAEYRRDQELYRLQDQYRYIKQYLSTLQDLADEYTELGLPLNQDMIDAQNYIEPDFSLESEYDQYHMPPLETFMPGKEEIEVNAPKGYNAFQRAGIKVIRGLTGLAWEDHKAKRADKKKERAKEKATKAAEKEEKRRKKEEEARRKAELASEYDYEEEEEEEQEKSAEELQQEKEKAEAEAKALEEQKAREKEARDKEKADKKPTAYEEAYNFVLNFRELASRFEDVKTVFKKFEESYLIDGKRHNKQVENCMEKYVRQVSDLLLHSDKNSPRVVINGLEDCFTMIARIADNAEKLDDAENMVKYLSGACFGAKMEMLASYMNQSDMILKQQEPAEQTIEQEVEAPPEEEEIEFEIPKDGYRYLTDPNDMPKEFQEKSYLSAASALVSSLIDEAIQEQDFTNLDGGYMRWPHFEEVLPMLRHFMLDRSFAQVNSIGDIDYESKDVPRRVMVTEEMLTSLQMREYLAQYNKIYDKQAWELLRKRKRKPVDMWHETRAEASSFKKEDGFENLSDEEYLKQNYDMDYDPDTFVLPPPLVEEKQKDGAEA